MIYVDELRPRGNGEMFARMFTDDDEAQLHAMVKRLGPGAQTYKPPKLAGAEVVRGGYYVISEQQRERAVRLGAARVSRQPDDLPLAGMLAVAQAEARRSQLRR